jgi:hypothetical protein
LLTVAFIVSLDATVALLLAIRSLPAAIAAIAPAGLSWLITERLTKWRGSV